jgi:GntR family transcriptional regulator
MSGWTRLSGWQNSSSRGSGPPGARLPSITTLMQEHGVARNTARRALAILEDEGLIEIVHGWGSFVRKP